MMDNLINFLSQPTFFLPLIIWGIFWKGWALWQSSQRKHLTWFLIFLLANTLGVLEILYLFYLHKWSLGSERFLAFLEKKFKKKKG